MGALIIIFGRPLVNLSSAITTASYRLGSNLLPLYSSSYFILAILFAIQAVPTSVWGQSFIPTLAGIAELFMRIFAGIILVRMLGFHRCCADMANLLAWIGSCLVLLSQSFKTMQQLKRRAAKQTLEKESQDV